ncbi:hypothetical protein [Leptospira santarosai]|uniref:hypothetical protein n=1 Tax=Leptospira santarosai TaxID=28183 RepID=UPI0024AED288|nr:hypothetical protein [Leptospira santarosai]MDI7165938.1 hypothetical protein [Leptospira santarosai]
MKAKELIKLLSEMNPDFDVEYCTASGSSSGIVDGASEYEFDKTICLSVMETDIFGEGVPLV